MVAVNISIKVFLSCLKIDGWEVIFERRVDYEEIRCCYFEINGK
jgi:hypothetical protein